MRLKICFALVGLVCTCGSWPGLLAQTAPAARGQAPAEQAASDAAAPLRRVPVADYPIQEGYVDSSGVLIYYTTIGRRAWRIARLFSAVSLAAGAAEPVDFH
jgi:hypothetical protein